jgi:hypothetical protein
MMVLGNHCIRRNRITFEAASRSRGTPDGDRVAVTGPNKDVRLFDAASGEVMLSIKRPYHTAKPAVS